MLCTLLYFYFFGVSFLLRARVFSLATYTMSCVFHAQMTSSFPIFVGFADGASRHTQNVASATWVIYHSDELVSSGGIFLGSTTNNMAEYHVVIGLLTEASSLGISRIIVHLDSQLMVYQLNRIYTIHNPILLHLHLRVHVLNECLILSNISTYQENLIPFRIR
jgi:hypothetical protein